ncbi:hypothetical protein Tasa_016_034 [Tanticharoenia sakaeratensis NBRC 103193]|uniref:Uncharacterized protein n=1 Tax=Tanticharoenia sakaeratensis NBRC 103193 TaxID=1231623 RepID=A0A0D6MKB4_9PROT|nr:hypothetical protein Tasa_016_034 [Tanticharoenia sakaeratensis NBRC 103193]GBQ24672.1 hypothetical protein AA103193_2816 [Tanticharoenia sakaeratensis NBRC 103193]
MHGIEAAACDFVQRAERQAATGQMGIDFVHTERQDCTRRTRDTLDTGDLCPEGIYRISGAGLGHGESRTDIVFSLCSSLEAQVNASCAAVDIAPPSAEGPRIQGVPRQEAERLLADPIRKRSDPSGADCPPSENLIRFVPA